MPRRNQKPESLVLSAVLDLLAAEHIYALRINSGEILLEYKGRKSLVKLAPKGTADCLALVPRGDWFMPLWIETKAGKNGLSPEQESFRDDVLYRGHSYLLARDSDAVIDWLRQFRSRSRTLN